MAKRLIEPDGCFGLSQISKDEIFKSFERVKTKTESVIDILGSIDNPSWQNTVVPFYEAQTLLERFWSRFVTVYVYSKSNDEYQEAYGELYPIFTALNDRFFNSKNIIQNVSNLKKSSEYRNYTQTQKNYIESILLISDDHGTLLDEEIKSKVFSIKEDITKISQKYNDNVQQATQSIGIIVNNHKDLGDLPSQWREISSAHYKKKYDKESTPEQGPWYISMTSGVYQPFMKYSTNREMKKDIFTQSKRVASEGKWDNTENILSLISKRHESSEILKYKSYLDQALEVTTASKEDLDSLYTILHQPLKDRLADNYRKFRELGDSEGIKEMQRWDIPYLERKFQETLGFDAEEVKNYFPYPEFRKNTFKLFENCFSIKFQEATNEVVTWDKDVEFYWVVDSNGEKLGGLYIDPYQRPGEKIVGTQNIGAFCVTLREPSWDNDQYIAPVSLLSFGFPPPTKNEPSLCPLDEIPTYFHEFGHYFGTIFTHKENISIIPEIVVDKDTKEFESMVLEDWGFQPFILKHISSHYKTGEQLSDELLTKISIKVKNDFTDRIHGLLFLTKLSMDLYSEFDPEKDDLESFAKNISKEVNPPPYFENDKWVWGCMPLFTLDGYVAYCYMYLWAMATAHTYLNDINSKGWSEESMKELGNILRTTLFKSARVGESLKALEEATGRKSPDFLSFSEAIKL
jgi:oligopeptidase A